MCYFFSPNLANVLKRIYFAIAFLLFITTAQARHVAGGELYYRYISSNGTMSTYEVTLRLFRDCQSTGPRLENERATLNIYGNNVRLQTASLSFEGSVQTIQKNIGAIPCLVGNVSSCYEVAYYSTTIVLPDNAVGYTLTASNCCRIDNITNLRSNGSGTTFVTEIPGTNKLGTEHNTSAVFNVKDTTLVCSRKKFLLDFGATDANNDTLIFSLCDAYTNTGGANTILNLTTVPYSTSYNGFTPLGTAVTINASTGQITGTAPTQGQYVISVCVTEIRNGVPINNQKKDFILKVQDCDIADADLPEVAVNCTNFGMQFENQSSSSGITSYTWDFGVNYLTNDTSNLPNPIYNYPDTGTYKAILKIKGPNGCTGEDSMVVKVYPTFKANFKSEGSCFELPVQFTDLSTATYGVVTNWNWRFGDNDNPTTDTSTKKNPTYKYATAGSKTIRLITESTKGCSDTLINTIIVKDKPNINLAFTDTLICSIDTLPLQLTTDVGATINWLPNYNIINNTTNNPLVFPKDTTTYIVTSSIGGCSNTDSIKVNVLDFITVDAMADTNICKTDTIQLRVVSQALSYNWSNASSLNNAQIKNPLAFPSSDVKYYIAANLGKCQDTDSVTVKVFPYPQAAVTKDTSICLGTRANLRGIIVGENFLWQSPNLNTLLFANTLNPIAGPQNSTYYTLTAFNTTGCLKRVSDTVNITVVKPPKLQAGRDTSVVLNQPLQLQVTVIDTAALSFSWQPANWLSNANIASPIATFIIPNNPDSITYKVTAATKEGCSTIDDIKVKIYITSPDILIPDAFTPNNDGRNDVIRPIPLGITAINYFKIYNRWGQLLFSTNQLNKGWDGNFNSIPQQTGTYVYQAEAIDFTGKVITKQGVFILMR